MRLSQVDGERLWLQLRPGEKRLLVEVLQLYPLVDTAYHRATHSADPRVDQKLLEEALAALKQENQDRLRVFLDLPQRFQETKNGWRLMVEIQDVEWLLQVVNDIRVGSWLKLGMPDERSEEKLALSQGHVRYLVAMEWSGLLEGLLLEGRAQAP